MTKKEITEELQNARAAHVKWHAYAQALALGVDSGNEKLPQLYTDCIFGKWYYGKGNILNSLPSYKGIEKVHEEVHMNYMEIYNKYIKPAKAGMFTGAKKAEEKKSKELQAMVSKLKKTSDVMIMRLGELEEEVKALSDEKLLSLTK